MTKSQKKLLPSTKSAIKPFKSTSKLRPSPSLPSAQSRAHSVYSDEAILDFAVVNYVTVSEHQDGQRIDNFLLARLKGLPRSHLYKMIRDDEIRINKKRCKAHDRLAAGDVVRIAPVRLAVKQAPVVSDELSCAMLERIVVEDEGLIVLNKPFGMAVHGGSGVSLGVIETMRAATQKKYLELIHRIDKETSGLLLIAKKRSTLKQWQDAFRNKTVQKSYVCIALGHIKPDVLTIDKPLKKFTLPSGERHVRVDEMGKMSVTHIKVLARATLDGRPVSIVLAYPVTGRTHQIRVHLASVGHALLGDDKYQSLQLASVKRLMLHAYRIRAQEHSFTAPIAEDMAQIISQITDWQALIQTLDGATA